MKKLLLKSKKAGVILLSVLIAAAAIFGIYDIIIPSNISCHTGDALPTYFGAEALISDGFTAASFSGSSVTKTAQYRLFNSIPVKTVNVSVWQKTYLYPGGMPFGVRFFTDGLLVVGFSADGDGSNPAKNAGIRLRDVITHINGKEISSAKSLTDAVSGGQTAELTILRDGSELKKSVTPYYSSAEKVYKTGLIVRDNGAGIGTVTFIVPATNGFAGLGHGICDGDTGALIPLERGTVSDVIINGVVKGVSGAPGEIRGCFRSGKTGSIIANTHRGVFGAFTKAPQGCEALPIGLKSEIKNGAAHILCTLDDNGIGMYSVQISDIDTSSSSSKCFSIRITDPALLEKTGGIIQGMSGSPVIQNGKIVGAVTHVLINDPASGYGIFIENMLADMPDILK